MKVKIKDTVTAAVIATLYVVLTYMQALIFPGSTSAAVQFRISEALMMLTLFSPTAIYGLTVGCAVANILGGLPIDILIGSFATLIAGILIYKTRHIQIKNFPVLSLFFPALCNGIIVGAEIQLFFIGEFTWISFLTQAGLVALGELGVAFIVGIPLYYSIKNTNLF